jgi:hypothetical protein
VSWWQHNTLSVFSLQHKEISMQSGGQFLALHYNVFLYFFFFYGATAQSGTWPPHS